MITVDIVCPTGGLYGGVENVIKSWTKHINPALFNLRIFHMTSGMAYLEGYPKAYCINKPFEKADDRYCVAAYELFVSNHGSPDICIATNWPMMSRVCDEVRKKGGYSMKIISWVHSEISRYEEEQLGGITDMLHADAHFAINGTIQKQLLQAEPAAKVYRIGNPVTLQQIPEYRPDPLMLAYVGRLDSVKRLDIILEAIYRAKAPWKLKIIGDGELKENVRDWVQLLKLEPQVQMLGWKKNPWEECKDVSILLMASEYEGFGMTAFEASSVGITVISTPVDGIVDYIDPGVNGYLFPQENAIRLAQLLDDISDGALPICDCEACRNSVTEYAVETYFQKVEDILRNIVA